MAQPGCSPRAAGLELLSTPPLSFQGPRAHAHMCTHPGSVGAMAFPHQGPRRAPGLPTVPRRSCTGPWEFSHGGCVLRTGLTSPGDSFRPHCTQASGASCRLPGALSSFPLGTAPPGLGTSLGAGMLSHQSFKSWVPALGALRRQGGPMLCDCAFVILKAAVTQGRFRMAGLFYPYCLETLLSCVPWPAGPGCWGRRAARAAPGVCLLWLEEVTFIRPLPTPLP